MPQLTFTQSIGAGLTFDPLDGWNFQYATRGGKLTLMHKATAVGLLATFTATDRQILQEANVPAGGTSGVTPTVFTAPVIPATVQKGDRLSIRYRNPTGGAIIIDGVIDIAFGGKK